MVLRDVQIQAIRTAGEIDIVALTVEYLRSRNTRLPQPVLDRRVRMAIAHGRMLGLTGASALRDFAVEAIERAAASAAG
jgi:hypothetical protein